MGHYVSTQQIASLITFSKFKFHFDVKDAVEKELQQTKTKINAEKKSSEIPNSNFFIAFLFSVKDTGICLRNNRNSLLLFFTSQEVLANT